MELKMKDSAGRQLVTIDGRYAYAWTGKEELKVGDEVTVPGAWFNPAPWVGRVSRLGSDYDGAHVEILGRR